MAWPEPVERVAAFLRAAGAEARLEEFDEGTPTAQAAADAIGCALDQIVKSLVLDLRRQCRCSRSSRATGAADPGQGRDERRRRATPGSRARTRWSPRPGSTRAPSRPSPLRPATPVLVERTILSQPVVWVGAGSDRHMAALAPLELVRLTRGATVDVVQESA